MLIGYLNNIIEKIFIKRPCNGYYLRWWYSGWHYWVFLPGKINENTEGEKYRTIGTKEVYMGSGQITYGQCQGLKTIMNTREVYLLTSDGWKNIRIDPGSVIVFDNQINGYEFDFMAVIGSRDVFSPIHIIPYIPVDPGLCEVIVGTQIWMCKNWDTLFPDSKVYDDDETNRSLYGGLYDSSQILAPGFLPTGWHVPTLSEWNTLITYLGGVSIAGKHLKSIGTTYWNAINTGDDSVGLDFRGAGIFSSVFSSLKTLSYLWTIDPTDPDSNYFVRLKNDTETAEVVSANLAGTVTQNFIPNTTGRNAVARVDKIELNLSSTTGAAYLTCESLTKKAIFNTNKVQTAFDFVNLYQSDYNAIDVILSAVNGIIYFTASVPGVDFVFDNTSITPDGIILSGVVTDHLVSNIPGVAARARVDKITITGAYGSTNITCESLTKRLDLGTGKSIANFVSANYADYFAINVILSSVSNELFFTAKIPGTDFIHNNTSVTPTGTILDGVVIDHFIPNDPGHSAQARMDVIRIADGGTNGVHIPITSGGYTRDCYYNTNADQTAKDFIANCYAGYLVANVIIANPGYGMITLTAKIAGIDTVVHTTASSVPGFDLLGVYENQIPNRTYQASVARVDRLMLVGDTGRAYIVCQNKSVDQEFITDLSNTASLFVTNNYNAFLLVNIVLSNIGSLIYFTAKTPGTDFAINDTSITPQANISGSAIAPFITNIVPVTAQARIDKIGLNPAATCGTMIILCEHLGRSQAFVTSPSLTAAAFISNFYNDYLSLNVIISNVGNILYFTAKIPGTDFGYNDTAISAWGDILNGVVTAHYVDNVTPITAVARVDKIVFNPTSQGGNANLTSGSNNKVISFFIDLLNTVQRFIFLYYNFFFNKNIVLSNVGDVLYLTAKTPGTDSLVNTSLNTIHGLPGEYYSVRLIKDAPYIPIPFNDWFLPSKDELNAMYTELHLYGVGGFFANEYWSSTEWNATGSRTVDFTNGSSWVGLKNNLGTRVRACRSFTSATNYNLRDIGPAGGLIFWKSGNNYLESAPIDCVDSVWSNIINLAVGTGTAIGTGQANTTAIIGQAGHTTSAAKLCDDLIIYH